MTIYDIAEIAGVSASTVSRVINNKPGVGLETRQKIMKLMENYNYSPNAIARGLVSRSSKTIGILVADIRNIHHIDGAYYDFDKSSAIWRVTNGFESIEYCVGNNQQYRGCVVFSHPEGLLYATDAPFAANYIYLFDPETKSSKKLFEIHGSCIYGTKWNDDFVFSSTIEGDGRNTSRFEFYFGRKKGAGIKDDFIHLYKGNLENGFEEIYKLKKDIMPFYTFQFGVFRFPYGQNNSDSLFFQPVATNKHDLSILKFIKEN